MRNSLLKSVAGAGLLSMAVMGAAQAGGFSRGTADTDLLFEEGNFNMRFDARVVVPSQKFKTNINPALVGTNPYGNYIIPSAAVKFDITHNLRCEGTWTQNVGADTDYAAPKIPTGKLSENFHTDEFGAACAVRFDVGSKGVISVIGGGFIEQLTYDRVTDLSVPTGGAFPAGTNANLELKGEEFGWRAGLAYEIPEYKLRAQILYRSGTQYGADGTLVVPGALAGLPVPAVTLPATGVGQLPQSVELSARSGVAEDWLVFAAVKWTDWSVLQSLHCHHTNFDHRRSIRVAGRLDRYRWRRSFLQRHIRRAGQPHLGPWRQHRMGPAQRYMDARCWRPGACQGWRRVPRRHRPQLSAVRRGNAVRQRNHPRQHPQRLQRVHGQRLCRDPQRGLHRAMVSAAARP